MIQTATFKNLEIYNFLFNHVKENINKYYGINSVREELLLCFDKSYPTLVFNDLHFESGLCKIFDGLLMYCIKKETTVHININPDGKMF